MTPSGQAAARCAARWGGAWWCNAYLGRHQRVVRQPAIGKHIADAQEIAIRRRGRAAKPPAAQHAGACWMEKLREGGRPVIYSWNQVWIEGNTVWLIRTNKANKTKSLQTSQAHTWRVCNVYTGMCSLSVSRIQAAAAATAVTAADCICNPSTSNSPLKPTARLQLAHFVAICVESY